MTIHLYDGIAVIRRELETDEMGRAPRKIFTNMLTIPAGDVVIWCWDGAGAKAYRQAIYPNYKANRVPQPDGVWKTIQMMQDVLKHTKALQVTMAGYEADDLIAHFAKDTAPEKVLIHSIDRDLSALFNDRVSGTFDPPKGVAPGEVQLYKLCVGDNSDNIKGIPGFGEKTWQLVKELGMLEGLRLFLNNQTTTMDVMKQLPTKVHNWFNAEESWKTLRAMQKVISFRPLEEQPKFVVGRFNPQAGDAILQEFML
ncbi:MAG: hypothetical protein KGL39_50505 [Patescibacteria group bacterium]|nr:hypothetical protein [Patescibacteria group bacterium]